MRAVKGRDTAPEMAVRRMLHANGYRYRLHRKDLPGKPDLTFPSRRKVVFVHGCFWHGHPCLRGDRMPKTNADYWRRKIERNRERYEMQQAALLEAGWGVLTVWECELRREDEIAARLNMFLGPARVARPVPRMGRYRDERRMTDGVQNELDASQ